MAERVAASSPVASGASLPLYGANDRAGFAPRAFAYLLDSLILFALIMLFAAAAGLNIYLRSGSGRNDVSDATITETLVILLAVVPTWFLLNVWLSITRGQSPGQYVVGLQVSKENGQRAGTFRVLIYWLALHPLIFHWFLAPGWFLIAFVNVADTPLAIVAGGLCILSFLSPLIAVATALGDGGRRGLHDRVAGVVVSKLA